MRLKKTIKKLLQKMTLTFLLSRLFFLIVVVLLLIISINWSSYTRMDLVKDGLKAIERSLVVFVLSKQGGFERREAIRNTWALGHDNVFFIVGEHFFPHTENEKTSNQNINDSTKSEKDIMSRAIRDLEKNDVILVPTGDSIAETSHKVSESYKWALQTLKADWFMHVDDTAEIDIDKFEQYLNSNFDPYDNSTAILLSFKHEPAANGDGIKVSKPDGKILCGVKHVVARHLAQHIVSKWKTSFEYKYRNDCVVLKTADFLNISERYRNLSFVAKGTCNTITVLQLSLSLQTKTNVSSVKSAAPSVFTSFDNPSLHLHSARFDLIVKLVYAHFYVFKKHVPKVITDSYREHLKVWNNFHEYCRDINKAWYDSKRPCANKRNSSDFIISFHKSIDSIKQIGFNSNMSRIPLDKDGLLFNGAHRLAASIVLSKNASFEHHNKKLHTRWGYEYFKERNMSKRTFSVVMLQWMKIQMQLPFLKKHVLIVSVFSNSLEKDKAMLVKFVKEKCSCDNGILYETTVSFSKKGVRELFTHMYGQQSWIDVKIQQMHTKFKNSSTVSVLFLFVYGKEKGDLTKCKLEIRKLNNDKMFKLAAHISDTPEESLILAEMILNPNSIQFMNYANSSSNCKIIAKEIASRASVQPIKILPEIYLGRDDVMIDSGPVLGLFGLRKQTDIGLLFFEDVDKSVLGDRHGINIQAHAFKFNLFSKKHALRDFSKNVPEHQWDLFYDPQNFGFCYGVRFVSLEQIIRFNEKWNERKKDKRDVSFIKEFLKSIPSLLKSK